MDGRLYSAGDLPLHPIRQSHTSYFLSLFFEPCQQIQGWRSFWEDASWLIWIKREDEACRLVAVERETQKKKEVFLRLSWCASVWRLGESDREYNKRMMQLNKEREQLFFSCCQAGGCSRCPSLSHPSIHLLADLLFYQQRQCQRTYRHLLLTLCIADSTPVPICISFISDTGWWWRSQIMNEEWTYHYY